jgi:hypothetical protein
VLARFVSPAYSRRIVYVHSKYRQKGNNTTTRCRRYEDFPHYNNPKRSCKYFSANYSPLSHFISHLVRRMLYLRNRKTFNPNRSLDCYALMKPSFCHLFRYFSVTMDPHCAIIIITLMTDLVLRNDKKLVVLVKKIKNTNCSLYKSKK